MDRALDAYETALFWEATREALARPAPAHDSESDDVWERTLRDDLHRD